MRNHLLWILFAGGTCWGCGSAPPPTKSAAATEAAIRAAQEVGAHQTPEASLHLQLAKEQYDEAQKLIDEDETRRARLVLERARADAELALVLARKTAAMAEAQAVNQKVSELQSELGPEGEP